MDNVLIDVIKNMDLTKVKKINLIRIVREAVNCPTYGKLGLWQAKQVAEALIFIASKNN